MDSKRVLRLTGNMVALQPMRRKQSDSGLLYDMSRMDDRLQWLVLNMSQKAWESARGTIQIGDHVIVHSNMETIFEFPDKIIIADARNIIAVCGPAALREIA